jgi:predicted Zn finger-like uncharacterized protein
MALIKGTCPNCGTGYQIDDSKIPDKGAYGRCAKCKERFFVKKKDSFQKTSPNIEGMTCPHCHHKRQEGDIKCLYCGIVFAKYYEMDRVKEHDKTEEL